MREQAMKLAITAVEEAAPLAPFVLRGKFPDAIRQAAEIGYDAVELHTADPAEVDGGGIVRACNAAGVSVSSIGTGLAFLRDGVTLTHQDEAVRHGALERIKAAIEFGGRFGCVVIIVLATGHDESPAGSAAEYLMKVPINRLPVDPPASSK